tara:strand:- start:1946 stop:2170 length:225 start_codon:yes stop_codon:yes gene_type:complete
MTVTMEVTIAVKKELIDIQISEKRDIDSNYFIVYYNEIEIGSGHFNYTTNWAHVNLINENEDLERYIVNILEGE